MLASWRSGQLAFTDFSSSGEFRYKPDIGSAQQRWSWTSFTPSTFSAADTISMPRFSKAEIDFIADDPGDTFFHCHHQDHTNEGFAGLITYA